ncbi:DUF6308 family protein [Streptomyces sp. NPDC097619]|uniref:DUF6308 family protein n=1 Tax=Streptomyces sp. NPDC097619 TaxID=3157228 RepID=UPI0033176268
MTPSEPDPVRALAARVRSFTTADRAVRDLRAYFGTGGSSDGAPGTGGPCYSGGRFERLGGGGDREEIADRFTAEDLIAVQTLSVKVPAKVALGLLEGDLGGELSKLLALIPSDLDMVDAAASDLAVGSAADRAWRRLCGEHGVAWVIAGKLLARKRPRLIPVYDRVVRCALGRPHAFWPTLHGALRADGGALHRHLLELRREAGVPEGVSALRVCDVAVWMAHRPPGKPRTAYHTCP